MENRSNEWKRGSAIAHTERVSAFGHHQENRRMEEEGNGRKKTSKNNNYYIKLK
jgi:hypothetical protein